MPFLKQHRVLYYFITLQYLLKLILSAIFYKAQWTGSLRIRICSSNRASLYLPRFDCWLFIFCAMHRAWRSYSLACLDSAVPTEPCMSSVCSDLLTVAAKSNAWIKYFVQWFSLLQWQRVWGHKSALSQHSLQSCTCEHAKCKKVLNINTVGLEQLILCPHPPAYMLKAWCQYIYSLLCDS